MFCGIEAGWRSAAGASAATGGGGGRSRDGREPDGGPDAAPGGDQHGDDGKRRPGRVLHRACHPKNGSGQDRVPASRSSRRGGESPGEQRERQAGQGDHRRVGDPHRQRERHDRARQPERGMPEGRTPAPALPGRERDQERRVQQQERPGDQPGPRLTGQAERARQAEERHDREVGVIGQPPAGRQRRDRQVRGAMMQQQHAGPGHDRDIRSDRLPGHEPEGRRGQRPSRGLTATATHRRSTHRPEGHRRSHCGWRRRTRLTAQAPPVVVKPRSAEQGHPRGVHRESRIPRGAVPPAEHCPRARFPCDRAYRAQALHLAR